MVFLAGVGPLLMNQILTAARDESADEDLASGTQKIWHG
jgi:hypothetical protein